jgi:hypothetical protein
MLTSGQHHTQSHSHVARLAVHTCKHTELKVQNLRAHTIRPVGNHTNLANSLLAITQISHTACWQSLHTHTSWSRNVLHYQTHPLHQLHQHATLHSSQPNSDHSQCCKPCPPVYPTRYPKQTHQPGPLKGPGQLHPTDTDPSHAMHPSHTRRRHVRDTNSSSLGQITHLTILAPNLT